MSSRPSKQPSKPSQHEPAPKKKKIFQCKNCLQKCPAIRSLKSHFSRCIEVEEAVNVPINNCTSSQFNQELARGNIIPHQFRTGLQYQTQLHNHASMREQYIQHQQQEEQPHTDDVDISVDVDFETDPMDTVIGLQNFNPGKENDDEDSVFTA